MIKNKNIRTIVIALLICWVTDFIYPVFQTILSFGFGIEFYKPLTAYVFWGYSPLIFAGLYIGLSKAQNKLITGMIVGFTFVFIYPLYPYLLNREKYIGLSMSGFIYRLIKWTAICALGAWSTHNIVKLLKTKET